MKLGGITITVVNNGAATGYNGVGDPVYGAPTLTVVNGCDVQQHRTRRKISTTDVVETSDKLFAPATAPLKPTSIVVIGAITSWPIPNADSSTAVYIADGDPALWFDRQGNINHIECHIRRQAG